ncbi:putative farnesyl pyrophosphate synthetase protein [Neofusicoccum parvum UCRNP2]|uniref:Putative farnesyl pyrophosphate synthetase protein n=1 Tax=Botryosphaeria parva (strain UCR-NP2) TaxID=1287680 RepID=R1GNB6_BOTPV|nr:putative farnesyl pyrophosphate synthetase protein [Neofusicoccum parvum UCRNP2]
MTVSLSEFHNVFPRLVDDLLAHCKQYNLPEVALRRVTDSLNYNVTGGKCNRGISVIDTVSLLLDRGLTEDEFFHAATLGWMVELLQAFFLVSDDIMDHSTTRRDSPCWYRHVGLEAINDAFLLESAIYILLKKYFRDTEAYVELFELFHEVTFQTELGQACDLLTASEEADLDDFSLEKYDFIITYKTAYYSFYLPAALAIVFCKLASPENLQTAKDILIPMGQYFQIQDDYLDCFADPAVLGKIGTDIQENKCSWLINQALRIATPEQRRVLEENYGRENCENEAKVKEIYKQLELDRIYADFEEKRVDEIKSYISEVYEGGGLRKKVFEEFLRKIYKRGK